METITIKVRRHDPAVNGAPTFQEYSVPYQEGMRILDALLYIAEGIDPSLAYRYSCKIGNCKVCLMKANGKTVYSCQARLQPDMVLEPLTQFEDVRDLVCDLHKRAEA
jgi:succinate dehydrogenase/fumarate reductase-like Fe-S protein